MDGPQWAPYKPPPRARLVALTPSTAMLKHHHGICPDGGYHGDSRGSRGYSDPQQRGEACVWSNNTGGGPKWVRLGTLEEEDDTSCVVTEHRDPRPPAKKRGSPSPWGPQCQAARRLGCGVSARNLRLGLEAEMDFGFCNCLFRWRGCIDL